MAEPETQPPKARVAAAANLFDLRRIIGGVFVVYGVLLAILGLFEGQEAIDRAAGVNINLWAGLGMLVFGILMFVWALTRPLADEFVAAEEEGSGPMDAPPPRGVDAAALGSHQRSRPARRDDERTGGGTGPGPQ
jgi:hypothetical protein